VLQQRAVARTPTVLWTDVTPALLDEQAGQYEHPVDNFEPIRRLKHALVRRTFQNARLCIAWSEWARGSIAKAYDVPEERTTVVAPGIDLTRFVQADAAKPGLPRLLFVGGNFVRKGGDLLLDVFEQHFKGRYELDIVTRDPIAERPGVRVHRGLDATSPQLLALYDAATAFVLPTRGDCFSIASLEAMAKSLPVLVSGVGGIPEIIEHGSSGWLLGSDTGTDLKTALDSLLVDTGRAKQMGVRGREIVTQRFDAQHTAARLLTLVAQSAGIRPD
jgi:glycosyltransferase involved in cell wall biosynthesis